MDLVSILLSPLPLPNLPKVFAAGFCVHNRLSRTFPPAEHLGCEISAERLVWAYMPFVVKLLLMCFHITLILAIELITTAIECGIFCIKRALELHLVLSQCSSLSASGWVTGAGKTVCTVLLKWPM
jgi:hypothetical protein